MVQELTARLGLFGALVSATLILSVAGCSKQEAAPPDTQETKEAQAQAAGAWSPDKVDAMKKALANRRNDNDGAPTTSGGKKQK